MLATNNSMLGQNSVSNFPFQLRPRCSAEHAGDLSRSKFNRPLKRKNQRHTFKPTPLNAQKQVLHFKLVTFSVLGSNSTSVVKKLQDFDAEKLGRPPSWLFLWPQFQNNVAKKMLRNASLLFKYSYSFL